MAVQELEKLVQSWLVFTTSSAYTDVKRVCEVFFQFVWISEVCSLLSDCHGPEGLSTEEMSSQYI